MEKCNRERQRGGNPRERERGRQGNRRVEGRTIGGPKVLSDY